MVAHLCSQALHDVAVAGRTVARRQVRKQERVQAVEVVGQGRSADRSGNTDDRVHPLRELGEIDEELQDIARSFRVPQKDKRHPRPHRPRFQVCGDLPGVVRRSGSSADDDRIDTVAGGTKRPDRRPERPGIVAEALAECARYQEHLHWNRCLRPLQDSRFGLVVEVVQPEIAGQRQPGACGCRVAYRRRIHLWGSYRERGLVRYDRMTASRQRP